MMGSIPPDVLAASRISSLQKHASRRGAEQGKTFFKEPVTLMGVGATAMRLVAREAFAEVNGKWLLADALFLCETLLADERLEVKGVGLLYLEPYRGNFTP